MRQIERLGKERDLDRTLRTRHYSSPRKAAERSPLRDGRVTKWAIDIIGSLRPAEKTSLLVRQYQLFRRIAPRH